MDIQTIAFIITGVLTILTTFFGFRYAKVKSALKESLDVGLAVVAAYEDNRVTDKETALIVKESKEAYLAWKNVFAKKV